MFLSKIDRLCFKINTCIVLVKVFIFVKNVGKKSFLINCSQLVFELKTFINFICLNVLEMVLMLDNFIH